MAFAARVVLGAALLPVFCSRIFSPARRLLQRAALPSRAALLQRARFFGRVLPLLRRAALLRHAALLFGMRASSACSASSAAALLPLQRFFSTRRVLQLPPRCSSASTRACCFRFAPGRVLPLPRRACSSGVGGGGCSGSVSAAGGGGCGSGSVSGARGGGCGSGSGSGAGGSPGAAVLRAAAVRRWFLRPVALPSRGSGAGFLRRPPLGPSALSHGRPGGCVSCGCSVAGPPPDAAPPDDFDPSWRARRSFRGRSRSSFPARGRRGGFSALAGGLGGGPFGRRPF